MTKRNIKLRKLLAEPKMLEQYASICIKADGKDTPRKLHRKAADAEGEAREKIVKLAGVQKTGTFAIVKIISIVEPVTPTIAVRKPHAKDDRRPAVSGGVGYFRAFNRFAQAQAADRMMRPQCGTDCAPPHHNCRCVIFPSRQIGKVAALAMAYGKITEPTPTRLTPKAKVKRTLSRTGAARVKAIKKRNAKRDK